MDKDMLYSVIRGLVKAGAGALVAHGVIHPEAVTANGIEILSGIILWLASQFVSWIHQRIIKDKMSRAESGGLGILLVAFMLLGVTGCQVVPTNKITIKGPTGAWSFITPKNVDITDLKAIIHTNGAVDITIARWSSTNDAQVVDKVALGRAAEISAWASMMTNVAASVAEGAVKGVK